MNPIDVSMLARIPFDGGQGRGRRRGGREESLPRLVEDAWAERLRILVKVAEGIEMRAEEIALIECMDSGPAPRFISEAAIRGANFRFFADQASGAEDGQVTRTATQTNTTSRHPISQVRVITPWMPPSS